MKIISLSDLTRLRSAPLLDEMQSKILLNELNLKISDCDWITIGIMGSNDSEAKNALREIIKKYSFKDFQNFEEINAFGKVFLKANQKSGQVYIRSENGLGVGILLTCQYEDRSKISATYGPFPLDFFRN